jgi:hypothetical protein
MGALHAASSDQPLVKSAMIPQGEFPVAYSVSAGGSARSQRWIVSRRCPVNGGPRREDREHEEVILCVAV